MIQGIVEILSENVVVQGLVGLNKAGDRYKIYPVVAPQSEADPYVVAFITSTDPANTKDSQSSLDHEIFDLWIFSRSYKTVNDIDIACRNAMDTGTTWSTDIGVNFDRIFFLTHKDGFEVDAFANGKILYVRQCTYGASVRKN